MYFLTNTTQSLQCATAEGIALPYTALDFTTVYVVNSKFMGGDGVAAVEPGPVCVTGYLDDTFRDLLTSPHEIYTEHSIKSIHIVNTDSITHALIFRVVDNGNARNIYKCQLQVGWTVAYYYETGWVIYDSFGSRF